MTIIDRRTFLANVAAVAPMLVLSSCATGWPRGSLSRERRADVVIIGGGLGGCAAALAAARAGLHVIMTEETDWIGGQLTAQAVPSDENQWIETIGGTRTFLALRTAMRDWYRVNYPLTERARTNPRLNPGNCWVSRIGCEPRVALAVLEAQLAPYIVSGHLEILLHHTPVRAERDRDRVTAVVVQHVLHGDRITLTAPYFVDATELGDLLPLSGTEYVVGAESQADTGEPHAARNAQPDNMQGFTMCFAMDYLPGETHTIEKPREYDQWRTVRLMRDGQPEPPLISFEDADSKRIGFSPEARNGYWSYRRVIDKDLFTPGRYRSDITIVNWAHNDYSFGSLCDVSAEEKARHIERAKQQSLSLLYWLQTEAPRPDGGAGWRGLRLRPDVMGTVDGLAKAPYIRESRRIRAEYTVLEQHVTREARMRETGQAAEDVRATPFPDSVGIGHYSMDLHITTRGDRGQYGATLPFQIPLGALIPTRVENLLPACKNIGVTHLTNGCYRLHPIEWNVGESVGTLVALCLATKQSPRAVRHTPAALTALQQQLQRDGVPLVWPHPL